MIRRVKEWLLLRRKWSFCGASVIVLAVLYVLCNSRAEWDSAAVLFALYGVAGFADQTGVDTSDFLNEEGQKVVEETSNHYSSGNLPLMT